MICIENLNNAIDGLITEIHCLEAKCSKLEKENEMLKNTIKEMSEEDI